MILVVGPPNNNDGVPVFVSTLKGNNKKKNSVCLCLVAVAVAVAVVVVVVVV